MKSGIICALAILCWAAPGAAAEGVIDVPSAFGVQDTADRMEDVLKGKGMTIFTRIDHSAGAGKVGIELRKTELIIFGNPKVGAPLMKCQQSIAIDLPQKALIWEDDKGKVWVSYNNPGYLEKRHGVAGCEEVLVKIEKALAGIVRAATGE
jgi:uncharacterized protein (DUF302 family)